MEKIKLVKKAISGNDAAFLKIIHEVKLDLYKTAFAYLRNENDALEAVQEVTYRTYQNIKKLKKPAYFKTWIIRIMINYCNDTLKQRNKFVLGDQLLQLEGYSENLTLMEIEDALQSLDERSREVLTMKYFNDLKISEIAILLDCPEGTVKTWLHKGLKSLRDKLADEGGISNV
ncbi:sigma-70 family RNA polymerase sigma factor [Cytobacillus purgationiresistens]|uniref:RNA polymerase sigma-70 factor (ECF subfamily) n=1 Tax=Cytobacillus purgationiresistens TaxID=863449 RepID=A0ABU0AQF3_9BACI|nr:sigma-70 family RNA polymerase sigma factor [Cytobacillus purgationiresistens]MDQ0273007.1 RNA polymerase sigma-70 factor (ECF subfamily) [Cytobacillus purgationiresistens]